MAIFDDALNPTDPRVDDLTHYGRKGMRWGQRIFSKNKTSQLTDAEVKARIDRLKLEKDYKDLMKEVRPTSVVSKGTKTVASGALKVLGDASVNVGKTVLTVVMLNQAKKALGKKYGEDAVDAMFGGKKK